MQAATDRSVVPSGRPSTTLRPVSGSLVVVRVRARPRPTRGQALPAPVNSGLAVAVARRSTTPEARVDLRSPTLAVPEWPERAAAVVLADPRLSWRLQQARRRLVVQAAARRSTPVAGAAAVEPGPRQGPEALVDPASFASSSSRHEDLLGCSRRPYRVRHHCQRSSKLGAIRSSLDFMALRVVFVVLGRSRVPGYTFGNRRHRRQARQSCW